MDNKSIKKLESDLWKSADLLRAESKLTSNQYCMPVLGLIFLRYALRELSSYGYAMPKQKGALLNAFVERVEISPEREATVMLNIGGANTEARFTLQDLKEVRINEDSLRQLKCIRVPVRHSFFHSGNNPKAKAFPICSYFKRTCHLRNTSSTESLNYYS